MEVYLDNSATTAVFPQVADLMYKIMTEDYGNPSSMHQKGIVAEKYLRHAKEIFAGILKVSEKEIFFTSGGTESDNFAVIGSAMAGKRRGKASGGCGIDSSAHGAIIVDRGKDLALCLELGKDYFVALIGKGYIK